MPATCAKNSTRWASAVTLIEPGLVDTPVFDSPKPDGLTADDIARGVIYAVQQPDTVNVGDVLMTPMPR